jgi:CDGSH-type Zn-finger protein
MAITITVKENGPYKIVGDDVAQTRIVDANGQLLVSAKGDGKSIALCRCGASLTKPFCDGTHNKIGFKGVEPAPRALDASSVSPSSPPAVPQP